MKKETIERVVGVLPDFFKNAVDYLKDNFDENGQDILGEASGTAGVIIKLVGKPIPVSFNLRNFNNYLSESKLGVISDYLLIK